MLKKSIIQYICWFGLYLICLSFNTGCNRKPSDVIEEKKLVNIMADMQLAEAYFSNGGSASRYSDKNEIGKQILAYYDVTQDEIDSTLAWYGRNLDDYSDLYEKVDKEILLKKKKILKNNENAENAVSYDNLWPYFNNGFLSDKGTSEGWTFSIDNPEITPGDKIIWAIHLLNSRQMKGIMGVEYDDGSLEVSTSSYVNDSKFNFNLQTDTTKNITRIFGNILLKEKETKPVFADSIKIYKLPYDSLEYLKKRSQKRYHAMVNVKPQKIEKKDSVI